MSFKVKILRLSVFAAALALSLVLGTFYSYRGSERRAARPLFSFLKTGTIQEIVFAGAQETVRLTAAFTDAKAGRNWSVIIEGEAFPASRSKAERFFELVESAAVSPALTESRENWARFGLGDEAAKRISFSGSGGKTEILLGKEDEAGGGQYIRFAGTDAVYLAAQSLSYYAERDSSYWSELRVFPASLKTQDIIALGVSGAFSWSIYRERKPEGIVWTLEGGSEKKLDQGKADTLTASLSQLHAKAFAVGVGEAEAGLTAPEAVFILSASNQARYELRVGRADKEGNRYCSARVNGEGSRYIYLLEAATAEKFLAPPDSLVLAP
jgi:hypothetical protein